MVYNRPPTQQEKEYEALPFCPFEPLGLSRCENREFPPVAEKCKHCIFETVATALANVDCSTAMRWFVAYKNLMEKQTQ